MKRPNKRRTALAVSLLEERCLLSGPTGTWIGQDGHDFVGLSRVLGGNGVQDIHIAVAGLPPDRTIALADIQGFGGGRWQSTGVLGWMAAVVRASSSPTADLYIEPYQVETGRSFDITLTYDNGSTAEFWVNGGTADPNLRMPDAAVQAQWIGQDGHDLVGPGPAVGPDGIQDVHIALSHLAATDPIESVTIDGPTGFSWQYGLNPQGDGNAELVQHSDNPTLADLYINPTIDLAGQTLKVSLVYADGKTDSTQLLGQSTNPTLQTSPPAPLPLAWNQVSATWVGQDGQNLTGAGDVHVALDGLPAGRKVVAATLSDGIAGSWVYRSAGQSTYYADPSALPLAVAASRKNPAKADLDFPPIRNESGATMTLRLLLDDGTSTVTTFAGGFSDPGLRSPSPAPSTVAAHPGDDLNDLANRFGQVHLTAGTYNLNQPLILNNPVKISADPGATILFSQAATDPTWTAAIKIHSGHTTLDGFAVRFATPIRWNWSVISGPAVIGTTDNLDQGHTDVKEDVVITHMDIASPPAASSWELTPDLIRMMSASSGQVSYDVLKGGTTEVAGGPWQIVDNDYQGTAPDTYTYAAFAGHFTHDLMLLGNQAHLVGPSGKTWRFLVLTQSGSNDQVDNNSVSGIGPLDNDTVPNPNATELILTESYRVHFEGKPAALSSDGRVIQITQPQGDPAQAGDVVAIVSGPEAGQWRTITQAISPTAYLLDKPLPQGDYNVTIATGFVHETFQSNTIDSRGSSVAIDLDLRGNHYGTEVLDNHLLGGAVGLQLTAAPTERPVFWGWTHAPFLGGVIEGNTIEDSLDGGLLSVEHSTAIKSNKGRVYMTATLQDNLVEWTDAFLALRAQNGDTSPLLAFTVGDPGSIDPDELILQQRNNSVRGPAGYQPGATLVMNSALVNGQEQVDQKVALPNAPDAAPGNLRLANDSGLLAGVAVSTDGLLQFDPALGAAGYEYKLASSSTYTALGSSTAFVPAGLVAGVNTVFVRAFDDLGQRGPDAVITFVYTLRQPATGVWLGQDGNDLVGPGRTSGGDGVQDIHIALAGLPADRTITFAKIVGVGGGEWQYNGPAGPWKAALVRAPGATTAGLFIQPYRVETGRLFWVALRYDDGTTAGFWVLGGKADPLLKMSAPRKTPTPGPKGNAPSPRPRGNAASPQPGGKAASPHPGGNAKSPVTLIGVDWTSRPLVTHATRRAKATGQTLSHSARHRLPHAIRRNVRSQSLTKQKSH